MRGAESDRAARTGQVWTRAPDPGSAEGEGPDSGLRTGGRRSHAHTLIGKVVEQVQLLLATGLLLNTVDRSTTS